MIELTCLVVLQVIDFGSSCFEHQRVYTYIQSRFYRAPEVILGARYGTPIDMWSVACILVELLTGYPLFAGEDEGDQLACIIEMKGTPPAHVLDSAKRTRHFITSQATCSLSSHTSTLLNHTHCHLFQGTHTQPFYCSSGMCPGPPGICWAICKSAPHPR